jgi:predicted transport protein
MSDIKLFKVQQGGLAELLGQAAQIEKSLQTLCEANLDALLGVRFLATEHSTGPVHGGRIDTLGIDENGSPVIIEYKRAMNENVINQGLFYLEWMMDHKKEIEWLVLERFGADAAKGIDWSAPRLICIAGDFTRYDLLAVKQIPRNIELLRYRRFGGDLLMIELVHMPRVGRAQAPPATSASEGPEVVVGNEGGASKGDPYSGQLIAQRIAKSPPDLRDLYDAVSTFLAALGDDVQVKELRFYIAFKRIKNFACVEVYPKARVVTVYLKLDPGTVAVRPGFTRDVRKIGHFGTGDVEVTLKSMDDLPEAQLLFQRAYDGS